jgi:hypothetical protein
MGLKNWLAKNVAGIGAYGGVIGREGSKNGLALGRTLYLGHGTHTGKPSSCVFENTESMSSDGFSVYCSDPTRMPPNEDSSQLSILTRAAGVGFAARVASNTANCFSNAENMRTFRRSLAASTALYLEQNSPDVPMELLLNFMNQEVSPTVTKVLDLKRPGTGDLFGTVLIEVSNQHKGASVGFQRRGVLGFDHWVVSLVEQTISAIERAAQEFGW